MAVDRYIYVIGGLGRIGGDYQQVALSECSRFDTEGNEWQRIAPLDRSRTDAFGVCKNEHIFIAGGSDEELLYAQQFLNSCELYNIQTNEWQYIASLTRRRTLGRMVLIGETLYVLGGVTFTKMDLLEYCDKIEYYDHGTNEWKDQATVHVRKITRDIKGNEELL